MSMSVASAASIGRATASPLSRLVKRGAGNGKAAAPSRSLSRGARADATIIDGKAIALDVREEIRVKVEEMKAKHGKVPGGGQPHRPIQSVWGNAFCNLIATRHPVSSARTAASAGADAAAALL